MSMQVTKTLPESTYQAYLRFGALARFLGQFRHKISVPTAEKMLIIAMAEISEDKVAEIFEQDSQLVTLLEASENTPVVPEIYLIASFYRVREMVQEPAEHSDKTFVQIMQVILQIIAASYGKPLKQVMADQIKEFERFDENLARAHADKTWDFLKAVSPSKELH